MDFIPYKINEYLENVFYQIPKELFVNPYYKNLNSDSKLLYSLLLDRLSVSMKNEWIDKEGNIFLIFSRKEAGEKLNLSDKTVTKAFKQLSDVKLIYERKQGFKKNNIIYVGKINHISTEKIMSRKNYDSRNGKTTSQESENLRCNKNKYNKNNYSNRYDYVVSYLKEEYADQGNLYALTEVGKENSKLTEIIYNLISRLEIVCLLMYN